MNTAYVVMGEIIDDTTIKLNEPVPFQKGTVTVFIESQNNSHNERKDMYGILKGDIIISEDFNEPLDCFKEYSR